MRNLAINFAVVGQLKRADRYQVWAVVAGHDPAGRMAREAEAECRAIARQYQASGGELLIEGVDP